MGNNPITFHVQFLSNADINGYPRGYPHIPGGVMNGFVGDRHDRLYPSSRMFPENPHPNDYCAGEYWTPNTAYTLWYETLMANNQSAVPNQAQVMSRIYLSGNVDK
jgi:hypothetical protein